MMTKLVLAAAAALSLAACGSETADETVAENEAQEGYAAEVAKESADAPDSALPYGGIAEEETLHFTGTEPFWGGEVAGRRLTYKTPEDQTGAVIEIERFAGRGGVSFSGTLEGAELEMMVTPLACSDGMSDRTYPFTVTLMIGKAMRGGCGWTDRQPFEGPEHP